MAEDAFKALVRDDWIAAQAVHHIARCLCQDAALVATLVQHKYAFEVYDRDARPCLLYYAQGRVALVDWSLCGQAWAVIDQTTVYAYDQCLHCGEDLSRHWGPVTYGPLAWDPEHRDAACTACGRPGRGQRDLTTNHWRRVPYVALSDDPPSTHEVASCLTTTPRSTAL